MSKYCRLDINGVVIEVCDAEALSTHEPRLAAIFIVCPDNVTPNSVRASNGTWTIYAPPPAPPEPLPLLTPMTLYMAFKPAERIAIKTSTDAMVIEFWDMYKLSVQLEKSTDPNLVSVQEALAYLAAPKPAGAGILASSDRVAQILAGVPQ